MRKALGSGAVAAIALGLGGAPADAAPVKLTFEIFMGDDPQYVVGVFGERGMPFFSNGSFQIVFDPSKSIAPTNEGLKHASVSVTFGVGEFLYGGFGNHVYKTEVLNVPSFYSYDAAKNYLYFGSNFTSETPGDPCRSPGVNVDFHCSVMIGFNFAEGSYSGHFWSSAGIVSWMTNPNPAGIFQYFSYTVEAVPEPSTWGMLIAGFASLGMRLRRRQGILRNPA